jgi:cell wall-associated NlpC family hydrolase
MQPFLLAHAAVHAVAAPIVYEAPKLVFRVATAPLTLAYRNRHPLPANSDEDEELDQPQSEDYAEPMRIAYTRPRAVRPPRAESAADDVLDDPPRLDADARDLPEIESRGPRPTVNGSRAILRNGVAYAPSHAPQSVKNAIWAVNGLRHKPYIWGGGHGSFYDRGYDCSGTVSFALHNADALSSPLPASDLQRYGERGPGRWITIYSRPGHTFAMMAGLRLDTTDFQNGGNTGPRWHVDSRDTRGYVSRHPAGM